MPETLERSPIAHAPISVLLFAFNAAADLEEAVAAWDNYLAGLARPYEILLVNDGSTDDTRARADKLAEHNPHLKLQHHERHAGVGAALRTGLQMAQYPLLVTATCDKQFQPPDLYRILESIDQVDLVTGFRVGLVVPGWVRLLDAGRRLLSRVLLGAAREPRDCWVGWGGWRRRWQARWLFGVRVQDPECPFRLYRRALFERIPLQCDSAAVQIEILAKANHLEYIMAEVPVSWDPPPSPPADVVEQRRSQELRRLFFAPNFRPGGTL